jgi:hypothetical protein
MVYDYGYGAILNCTFRFSLFLYYVELLIWFMILTCFGSWFPRPIHCDFDGFRVGCD